MYNQLATYILDECMPWSGKPERVNMQNVDHLHAYDCYQNVTEPQATEYHTYVLNIGTI